MIFKTNFDFLIQLIDYFPSFLFCLFLFFAMQKVLFFFKNIFFFLPCKNDPYFSCSLLFFENKNISRVLLGETSPKSLYKFTFFEL